MKKEKLLYCSSSINGGGITSYTHEFIKSLSDYYDITIILGTDNKSPLNADKVKVIYKDMNCTSYRCAKELLQLIEEIKPIIIFNNKAKLLSLITPYISDNIRIVSICHSLRDVEVDIGMMNYNYSDRIIALGKINKESILKNYKIDNKKIAVINNYVSDEDALDVIPQKENNIPLRIVFSGGCAPSKNPEYVISVLNYLLKTDYNFEFIWFGNTRTPKSTFCIIKDIKTLFDDKRIKFLGQIPRKEAVYYSSMANIYILPSRREGCPMSMLEALRCGAICLTTNLPVMNKELIKEGKNGFICDSKKPKECANIIIDIIKRREEFTKLHKEIAEDYKSTFGSKIWCEQMKDVLDNSSNHKARKKKISKLGYLIDKQILNFRLKRSYINRIILEQFMTYYNVSIFYLKHKLLNH